MHCNPASPWYQNNKGLSSNDSSKKVQQIHLTPKEKKVVKIIAIVVLVLTGIISLLLGLERGFSFFVIVLLFLLFGGFVPYIFLKDVYLKFNQWKNKNKYKQLELPL